MASNCFFYHPDISGNQRVVYDYGEDSVSVPDGMAIDVTGKLWVASFYGGEVRCIDPVTGMSHCLVESLGYII